MTPIIKNLLYWSPRILCILFALFLSLFALDVFDGGNDFWTTLIALAAHLAPSAAIIALLIIAWHREWIGGTIFFLLAVLYIVSTWGRFPLAVYLMISGPMFVISILFFINWKYRSTLRHDKKTMRSGDVA